MSDSTSAYAHYIADEWQRHLADPARSAASLAGLDGARPRSVLEIGCGAGQELVPFARAGARCVGLDPQLAAEAAQALWRRDVPDLRACFLAGSAETLPFAAGAFDVVICRLALPYMHNRTALAEMARVLSADGRLLLKYHHARYYLREAGGALRRGRLRTVLRDLRVAAVGSLYVLTGRQLRGGLAGGECFTTERRLGRELAALGLGVSRRLADDNPCTPAMVIARSGHRTMPNSIQAT